MFSEIEGLPDHVVGVEVSGKISVDDYRNLFIPLVEKKLLKHERVDVLCRFDEGWSGIDPGAVWEDLRTGMGNLGRWGRIAVVTDTDWLENSVNMFRILWPGHLKAFDLDDYDQARAWVSNLERATVTCRIDEETGVVRVEPNQDKALSEYDFSLINQVVDSYLADHDRVTGILIASRHFPGWQGMGAMMSHMRFVRDHHRQIERIAIATDSPLGKFANHTIVHFIAAEVRNFSFDAQDDALGWLLS